MLQESKQIKKTWYEWFNLVSTFLGTGLAIIGIVTYAVIINIILNGLKYEAESNKLLLFLIIGGVFGFLIGLALIIQGFDLALMVPEVKEVKKTLISLKTVVTDEKFTPMWVYMLVTILKNVIIKIGSIVIGAYYVVSLSIEPLATDPAVVAKYQDLATSNILVFAGFGLVGLAKAFNYYIENALPLMKREIAKLERSKENELLRGSKEIGSNDVREHAGHRDSESIISTECSDSERGHGSEQVSREPQSNGSGTHQSAETYTSDSSTS